VFSAGVSAGFETTLLGEFLSEQHSVLRVGAGQASACNISTAFQAYVCEAPMSEHLLMIKLETHAIALEKKENEAFLSIYAPDQPPCNVLEPLNEGKTPVEDAPPCANVDSRTIDAAVRLLGRTFGWQTLEYQEKAVQFCAQAVAQFAKAGGKSAMGIFSSTSEEERRRKDRMNYSTIRIVLATLCSVVRTFPALEPSVEDAPWRQTVVGMLYDMLAHPSYTIRSAAATGLSEFALKAPSTRVVSTVSAKIRTLMMTSLEKRVIDANSALDHAGYLVALSSLWGSVGDSEDVKSLISTVLRCNYFLRVSALIPACFFFFLLQTVFDSLRKVTSSLPFRAQGLLTLSVFVQDLLGQTAITGKCVKKAEFRKVLLLNFLSIVVFFSRYCGGTGSARKNPGGDRVPHREPQLQRLFAHLRRRRGGGALQRVPCPPAECIMRAVAAAVQSRPPRRRRPARALERHPHGSFQ